LGIICDALGYSRQAYYKHLKTEATELLQEAIVVKMVEELRRQMPRLGGKKLYYHLTPEQAHQLQGKLKSKWKNEKTATPKIVEVHVL